MSLSRFGIEVGNVSVVTRITTSANNGGRHGTDFRRHEQYHIQCENWKEDRRQDLRFSVHLRRTQYGLSVDRDMETVCVAVPWWGFNAEIGRWTRSGKAAIVQLKGSGRQDSLWLEVQEMLGDSRFLKVKSIGGLTTWYDEANLRKQPSEIQTGEPT